MEIETAIGGVPQKGSYDNGTTEAREIHLDNIMVREITNRTDNIEEDGGAVDAAPLSMEGG